MSIKLSIIGTGRVGSTLAYTVMLKELVSELVLVGRDLTRLQGHALDLQDGHLFLDSGMKIGAGDLTATVESDIVVLSASVPIPRDIQDRLELAVDNARLFANLVPEATRLSPHAIVIVVTNPVDVLTYFSVRFSGFDHSRVIGTGTLIDSARFRDELSKDLAIHPADLRAYVLGEHGDSQFPVFSTAIAGGEVIKDTPERRALFATAKRAGHEVLRLKGYTNYAIAMACASIIEAIVRDTHYTLPVSTLINGFAGVRDVCLSIPVVIGAQGIVRQLRPELNDEERAAFRRSAQVVRNTIEVVEKTLANND